MVILTKKRYQKDKILTYSLVGVSTAVGVTGTVIGTVGLVKAKKAQETADKALVEVDIRCSSLGGNIQDFGKVLRGMQDVMEDAELISFGKRK